MGPSNQISKRNMRLLAVWLDMGMHDNPRVHPQQLIGVDVGLGAQLLAFFAALGEPAWP